MREKKRLDRKTKSVMRSAAAVIETLVLSVVYYIAWRLLYAERYFLYLFEFRGKYVLAGVYAVLAVLFINNMDGFQVGNLRRLDLALAQWIGMFITNFITYFQLCLIANGMITPWPMLIIMAIDAVICVVCVFLFAGIYNRLYAPYDMIMIYGSDRAVTMKIKMDKRREKYRVDKLMSADQGFEAICREIVKYDAVVINDVQAQMRNDILKFCYGHELRTYVIPKVSDLIIRESSPVTALDTPMLVVDGNGLSIEQRFLKRAMDIIISLVGTIVASPIMAIVAIAIKCEDGGPVFFKQKRVTLGGREFNTLKFRSMIVNAEKETGAVLASENDSRITKVGRFIRATRLDEIPQLLNILKGDMSVVGPRPERKVFIEEYCKEMPEFAYRTKVKAGLTGYAQIYGKYNTSPYDKLRLDMMYISNYSLLLDIKLILTTVRVLFSKESTEGIDVAQENQKRAEDLLEQIHDEQEDQLVGAGK